MEMDTVEYGSIWKHKKSGLIHTVLEVGPEEGQEQWNINFKIPKGETNGVPIVIITWSEQPNTGQGESFMGRLNDFLGEFTFVKAAPKK